MCDKEPLYALGTGAFFYSVLSSDEIVFSSAGADCLERFGPSALHFPRGRQITNNEEEEMKKKMSRTLAVLMCLMTAVAFMPTFAFAEEGAASEQESVQQQEQSVDAQAEEPAAEEKVAAEQEPAPLAEGEEVSDEGSINVVVAINVKGTFEVKNKTVKVTDYNKNGSFDIDDTLYCAHEQNYKGGAAAGYNSYTGSYGLSLGKLWGDDSGSFGYYVNNASAWSLADVVKDGDYVYAFVYSDGVGWSDKYSYFDSIDTTALLGADKELILTAFSKYDENYNPVFAPYSNAIVKVDGETKGVTDENGKIVLKFEKPGKYEVTATAADDSGDILVTPLCNVTVTSDNVSDYQEAFALSKAKEAAVAELTEGYKLESYRSIVRLDVSMKLLSGIVAINAAKNESEVSTALITAKTGLNKIKTDAQMTADENVIRATGISSISVKAGKRKATVKWSRNSKFSGYQIYYKQAGKKAKYAYASSTASSKTIKSLKKGKKYSFKVRGYKKMNGKTIYSNKWSATRTVRVR